VTDLSLAHHVLPARAGNAPHPCLILLHGRGGDEQTLLPLARHLDERFLVVSARGPHKVLWGGYRWYDLDSRGLGFPDRDKLLAGISLVRRLIQEISVLYSIEPGRLFLSGFSAGAVMAGTLALLHPELVQGAAMLGGYLPLHSELPFRVDAVASHHFFVGHGTEDRVVPVSLAREARDYLAGTEAALTYREYAINHQICPEEIADLAAWSSEILLSVAP
jgi:phospholipase/carboxylesterase